MRIAQLIPSLVPTGPVNVALDLCTLLSEAGHEVSLFYFDKKPGAVTHPKAQHISFWEPIPTQQFDVIHSHGLRPDAYVWRNARKLPPAVSTLHNYVKKDLSFSHHPLVSAIFSPLWSGLCSRHRANVVLSQHMRQYYQQFWKNQQLVVIPNTRLTSLKADVKREEQIRSFAQGKKVVGSISNFNPVKGLEQLPQFIATHKDWVYVQVGGGNWAALKAQAQSLGVANRCLFLGSQPQGYQYARAFNVFALPSRSEGFPLALLEAVQLQIPAVTSNLPIFKELFPADAVVQFKLDDKDSLATAILKAEAAGPSLTEQAWQHYQENYTPALVFQKYEQLYQSIL